MVTDGPDPPPCEREIYERGTVILVTAEVSSNRMEGWVKKVAERSGQSVDWHFLGGQAVVKAIGDIKAVKEARNALRTELDALYRESLRESNRLPVREEDRAPWLLPIGI